MSNFRRHIAKAKTQPYDAEVEYLEVNQTNEGAFIELPFVVNDYDNEFDTEFVLNGYSANASASMTFIGSGYSSGVNLYRISRGDPDNSIRVYNGSWDATNNGAPITLGAKTHVIMNRDGSYSINGTSYLRRGAAGNENHDPIVFFKTSKTTGTAYMRLYSYRWIKADKLILDLIPVRKGKEGFMYDKVSGKLYGNSGSGKFIVGPDKVKEVKKI